MSFVIKKVKKWVDLGHNEICARGLFNKNLNKETSTYTISS